MTSFAKAAGLGLVVVATVQVSASAATQPAVARAAPAHKAPAKPSLPAPSYLSARIDELGSGFNGRVGIAVRSVDEGWETGWKDRELYPQQSVSKLWVAITALDAVDQRRVELDDRVTLTRADLTLFHQPIAAKVLAAGSYTTDLDDLLTRAITTSDNTANDKLLRSVGGYPAVRDMITRKGLGAIRFANGERAMQSKVAGLPWSQSYSIGGKFFEVRNQLPMKTRRVAFNRYIADPYDGAAPAAVVNALAALKRGELLSPQSTAYLLGVMSRTHTGPNRLKGGLQPGWTLNHKTGTGQELGGVQTGYNDIGILTAPDGRSYAVAVMIKRTTTPLPVRMTLMSNVTRAVIEQHNRIYGGSTASPRRR